MYQQKEKWPEAVTSYQKSLDLTPRWPLAALRLGDAYQEVGETEKALEVYRKGIKSCSEVPSNRRDEIKPTYAKLCSKTARTLLKEESRGPQKLEEAVKLFQESVMLEPNDANNWYRLGCALLV